MSAPPRPDGVRRYRPVSEKIAIPMRDGLMLTAVCVRPETAEPGERFPCILKYDPYRGAEFDGLSQFGYWVEHGYYGVQLDVRGTGAAPGLTVANEYSDQEITDGEDAVAWLAAQPWCNGKVGMCGYSYSGINQLLVAARRPPALAAIIPEFFTDDVYRDDVIFYDGALQCESLGRWPFAMIANMGLPAGPDYDTETPEALHRMELEPWLFEMLRHQTDDGFWRDMALRPRWDRIAAPTFMIAGWLDAYTDSFTRLMTRLQAPRKALIGPWTHGMGKPGPAVNIEHEKLRWWDRWLKGLDNGVTEEPPVTLYVNRSYRPSLTIEAIPGAWRTEESWPVARVFDHVLHPRPDGGLGAEPAGAFHRDLAYKATVGLSNRYRCPHSSAELPVDQRADDAYSLSFDSAPLEEEIEILGTPRAILHVSATAPVANWIVRLCDVAPDGSSTLVTKGVLNGPRAGSHTAPRPLEPGSVYPLEIDLKVISWIFPPGHRIRFSMSNADFPNLWPTPYPMSTRLHAGDDFPSRFVLPVCPPENRPVPAFAPFEQLTQSVGSIGPRARNQWTLTRDEMSQTSTVFRETVSGGEQPGDPVSFERRWSTACDRDPAHATIVAEGQIQRRRGEDMLTCKSNMSIESSVEALTVRIRRELLVNDRPLRAKEWSERIPRRLL